MNKPIFKFLVSALFVLGFSSGCDEDHKGSSHKPPEGQGAIVMRNNSPHKVRVFLDGVRQEPVSKNRTRSYDLAPGVYRVVLQEAGGDQDFREEVDVLAGQNTVFDVADGSCCGEFDVYIFFD